MNYDQDNLKAIFKTYVKYPNIMTPIVVEYKRINNYIVEISRSQDKLGFGMTVIKYHPEINSYTRCFDLDYYCFSIDEINEKIENLHNIK